MADPGIQIVLFFCLLLHSDRGWGIHPDPGIRGMPSLKKIFSAQFGPQFGLKIKGGGGGGKWAPLAPPLDSPQVQLGRNRE